MIKLIEPLDILIREGFRIKAFGEVSKLLVARPPLLKKNKKFRYKKFHIIGPGDIGEEIGLEYYPKKAKRHSLSNVDMTTESIMGITLSRGGEYYFYSKKEDFDRFIKSHFEVFEVSMKEYNDRVKDYRN